MRCGRSVRMETPGACCEHLPAPALSHRPGPWGRENAEQRPETQRRWALGKQVSALLTWWATRPHPFPAPCASGGAP